GIRVRNSCRAVLANSLLARNGTLTLDRGAVEIEGATARIDMVLSTFDDNHAKTNNAAVDGCTTAQLGRIDSVIFNNNHTTAQNGVDPLSSNCPVSFTDTFGLSPTPPGQGNTSADPLFASGSFHLQAGSPARDTADNAAFTLIYDPIAAFGVDVFSHDFPGGARPANGRRDMGMFEEP